MRTPTAVITDLGTEFGVEVGEEGHTVSHVFQGRVTVRLVNAEGRAAGRDVTLGERQTARVTADADLENAIVVSTWDEAEPSVAAKDFIRTMPTPESQLYSKTVLADKPLFYWNFDEASGPAIEQVRRMARDSLYQDGGASRRSHAALGSGLALGRAADLTGEPGCFRSLGMGYSTLSGAWAVEFWAQFTGDRSGSARQYLFSAGAAGNSPAVIFDYGEEGAADNELELFDWKGRTTKGPTIEDDRWKHVLFVYFGDGNTPGAASRIDIHLDGTRWAVERGAFLGALDCSDVVVGAANADRAAPFIGRIDELAIYDLASLTAEQIEIRAAQLVRKHMQAARPSGSLEPTPRSPNAQGGG